MSILRCASCDRQFDSDIELDSEGTGHVECDTCAERRADREMCMAPKGET